MANRLEDNEDDDEFISSDDEEDEQESNIDEREGEIENHELYSSEDENEEEEPERVTNLEWDDMNIDIEKREKQLQKMHLASNKIASNYSAQNKFV